MHSLSPIPLVEVTRGQTVESVHFGSIAAASPDGEVVFSLGEPSRPYFLRSCTKPFQTLAFLEQGGAAAYCLLPEEIALISASHSGTDAHVAVLRELQEKIEVTEEHLQCGAHPPYHEETARRMLLAGEKYHPNRHNCSGKHTGMLAFAKMIGAPLDTYLEPDHPVQRAILKTFAEMCAMEPEEIRTDTDGCSAPVFAVPLPNAALAFARLCQPNGLPDKRTHSWWQDLGVSTQTQ